MTTVAVLKPLQETAVTKRYFAEVDCDVVASVNYLGCRPLAGDGRAVDYSLTPKGFDFLPLIVFLQQ